MTEELRAKFTPGPWLVPHMADDDTTCNCRSVCDEGRYMGGIATIHVDNGIKSIADGGNDCPPLEEAKANARLIAAAPELYEALKECADGLEEYVEHHYARTKGYPSELRRYNRDIEPVLKARAALAKATPDASTPDVRGRVIAPDGNQI